MGNAASVEALPQQSAAACYDGTAQPAKRQPQKLVKPRVGNPVVSNRPRRMSTSAASTASSNTHLPVNPNPALRRQSTIASPVPVSPLPPSRSSMRLSPMTFPTPDPAPSQHHAAPEKERRSSLFRSKSSQEDRRSRRKSNGPAPPLPGERRSRANSMSWESEANLEYARRQVEDSIKPTGSRQSVNYDLSSYEASRLLKQEEPPLPIDAESVLSGGNDLASVNPSWDGPTSQEDSQEGLSRVGSEVSLFAPVRRRSVIQTPGLATRRAEDGDFGGRPLFRHSNPPAPAVPANARLDSLEHEAARVMSMPPPPRITHPEIFPRVETPSDGDYKQLGAMAFGSLRITNGAASPIPSVDGERQLEDTAQAQVTGDEDNVRHSLEQGEVEFVVEVGRAEEISAPLTPRLVDVGRLSRTSSLGRGLESGALTPTHANMPLPSDSWSKLKAVEARQRLEAEYSTNEVLDIREDADAKPRPERPAAYPMQQRDRTLARADSGIVATPMSDDSVKALSKADSGYSSNVSVRSVSSRKVGSHKDGQLSRQSSDKSSQEVASPKSNGDDIPAFSGPALFLDVTTFERLNRPASGPNSANISPVSPRSHGIPVSPIHNALACPVGQKEQQSVSPAPERRRSSFWSSSSPSTTHRLTRPSSTLSIGSAEPNKSRKNKLQRLLSGASLRGGPPSVHVTHTVEESVPYVPRDVEARLQEHSGQFPTNSKRLALHTQASKDTLQTIMSVDSTETPGPGSVRNSLVGLQEAASPAPATADSGKAMRRRSVQSAASIISRTSVRRKPVGSSNGHERQRAQQGDLIRNGFESHITSIDSIRNSVGNSAFDSAFAMRPEPGLEEDDGYRRRSMSMDAQTERAMDLRRQSSNGRPRPSLTPSRASPIPELPEMSPSLFKSKTPPPISLQNRSARSIRKNPWSRPQSTPPGSRTVSRRGSRESVQSHRSGFDDSNAPPVPPIDSRFPEFQHLRRNDKPNHEMRQSTPMGRSRPSSREPSPGADPLAHQRPFSATPNLLRKQAPRDLLRRQSSYEDYARRANYKSHSSQPRQYYESSEPVNSGSYYENQLRQLQDKQWGGEGWDEPSRYPPHGPPARHSTDSRMKGYAPPYRVLHSYNSPAYRNVPIWG